jgi:hypothetical protein
MGAAMKIRPVAPARFGATAFVTSCLVIACFAHAASSASVSSSGSYSGRTSQKRPISLRITGSLVKALRYRIDDRCQGGKRLFVRAWGFPPLAIKHHRFGGTFVAKAPASAKAIIRGTVSGTKVTGTLSDRTRNRRTHRLCTGKATFSLTRHASRRPPASSGLRQLVLSITMPLANERPEGRKTPANFIDPGYRNSIDGNLARVP